MRSASPSIACGFLVVAIGVVLSGTTVRRPAWPARPPADLIDSLTKWDGRWYIGIAESGYDFSSSDKSNIAFFPAYPMSVVALGVPGLSLRIRALLLSNLAFLVVMLLMIDYHQRRFLKYDTVPVALVLGVYPAGFYFHMAYSESTFLLVSLLFFELSIRKTPVRFLAFTSGLATAVRPVGVCLLAPLLMTLWTESKTVRSFLFRSAIFIVPATWGILLFIAYQWNAFGDPFAWMKAQSMWRNTPPVPWPEKLVALITLKPIWASYIPGTEFYWHQPGQPEFPLFSLRFMNPIFFVAAVALVSLGGFKRWLNAQELVFSAGLLAIPYITRGYDMCMESQARFTSVVFPMYMVIGILLSKVSVGWRLVYFTVSAFFLCAYTAFFCAGYVFI